LTLLMLLSLDPREAKDSDTRDGQQKARPGTVDPRDSSGGGRRPGTPVAWREPHHPCSRYDRIRRNG
jgi:hypothetical protein